MTSPYQKYKLTTHLDMSKIQNVVDYAIKTPSSSKSQTTTPPRSPSPKPQTSQTSSTNLPISNRFTNLENFPPLPTKLPTYAQTVTASRGGAIYRGGCAIAHPEVLKTKGKKNYISIV
jgi:hypothetical protein